jgi:predicted permease
MLLMTRRKKDYTKPYFWVISVIGLLIPHRYRFDWKREWLAELRHREALLKDWEKLDRKASLNLFRRSLGSFWDALWFQQKRLEEGMFQDLRYGIRLLGQSPVFTAVAVLSLALGIGANTAIFTLIDAALLRKLPVRNPDELVLLKWTSGRKPPFKSLSGSIDMRGGQSKSTSFSYPAFEQFRDRNETFSDVFAFAELYQLNASVDGRPEVIGGQIVSGGYYAGLGVPPARGRAISPDDDRSADAEPVAMISYSYWQRRFGRDPDAVGKTIYLNGSPFTIIGVTPPEFAGTLQVGSAPEITVPMAMQTKVMSGGSILTETDNWWVQIIGRLKPGFIQQQAQPGLDVIFQQGIAESQKNAERENDPARLELTSGNRGPNESREEYSYPLFILMGVVGLVLAIACVNIANLLLSRSATRQKEIAVRLALGASRGRLIRQLLTESVLLAMIGGAIGLIFASWGKDLLIGLLAGNSSQFTLDLKLDARVLVFTTAVSALTGILFGLAPALRATRIDLTPMLKDSSRSATGGKSRLSKALLVAQVAMSLLLLIGAGLFVRTLFNLGRVNLGFNAENLLLFRIDPTLNGYKGAKLASLYDQMAERIQAVPGVSSVTISRHPLLSGSAAITSVTVPGGAEQSDEELRVYIQRVRPNFLATMEIPLKLGRELSAQDNENAPKVAIINETFARTYFPDANPIGKRFLFGKPGSPSVGKSGKGDEYEIVGVARDAKFSSVRGETPLTVYLPYLQNINGLGQMSFEVRTAGDPAQLVASIREAAQSIDNNVPLFEVKTQAEQAEQSFAQERIFAKLSAFFGLLALLLACIGLYGIMSYGVARRTREIGIRMALGAEARNVLWLVMRETMILVLIGAAIGLPAALVATQLISSMLFGLTPTDPATVVFATIFMIGVAAFAGYLPARRASRVDPMVALRYE